ncbi:SET and MYND domain-containing protein 4 [Procambarus clarkii]|uniref:SET and MYND domain-containing protein 4 n=1 Tax=Procambarus clarkii TaxID=6728 RepID=UPI0037449633
MDDYEQFLKKIQEGLRLKEAEQEAAQQPAVDSSCHQQQQQHQHQQQQQPSQSELGKTQSTPSPSFQALYDDICQRIRSSGTLDALMKDFEDLKTDLERVKYVAQMNEIRAMKLEENYSKKSEEDAISYEKVYEMLIPNEASASKALEVMKKCIQKTPVTDTTTLALRYMKRGWASLLLEYFDDAKVDALKSLSFNCPEELLWNSFEILGYCSARINDNKAAESYFLKALDHLRKSNATNEIKAAVTGRVMTVFKTIKTKKSKKVSKEEPKKRKCVPQVSYGPHKNFPSASSVLDFVITEDRGRCTIAKKDIKPGDILMVDSPFCTMVNAEVLSTHCFHCYTPCTTPVPCRACAKVWYCSDGCEASSWSRLHCSECSVLNHIMDPGIGKMALLAYRVMTTVTWQGLQKWRPEILNLVESEPREVETPCGEDHPGEADKEASHQRAFTWKGKYSPRDYRTVLHLATNSTKRTFGDLLKRAITAVYLAHCLRLTGYFGSDNVEEEDVMFAASLLLRHLQGGSCNAYEIGEFDVGPEGVAVGKMVEVGGALYTTISLTNHSCVANATRYSVGDQCVLRATRSISRGSEVLDNYGFHFYLSTVNERQEALFNQYKFKCMCEACRWIWPLYPHHPAETLIFKCPAPSCGGSCCYSTSSRSKCNMCGNQQEYSKLLQELELQLSSFRDALDKLKKGDVSCALPSLLAHQAFLDHHIVEPVKHYTDTQEATRQCFNYQGNVHLPREAVALAQPEYRPPPRLKAPSRKVFMQQ